MKRIRERQLSPGAQLSERDGFGFEKSVLPEEPTQQKTLEFRVFLMGNVLRRYK